MGRRGKPRISWPKAAALVLGLTRGCLSGAVPPSVPPGWSVHFQEDTPYFHNEKTGETTWDQPRFPTTAAAPAASQAPAPNSAGRDDPPLLPSARPQLSPHPASPPRDRQHPPVQGGRDPVGKQRGWFGFGRGAEKQQQQQQQQDWRGAASPAGGRGGREGRSEEQWRGAGGRGWTDSGRGAQSPEARPLHVPEHEAFVGEELRPSPGASAAYDDPEQAPATGWGEGVGSGGGGVLPEAVGERRRGDHEGWWEGAAAGPGSVVAPAAAPEMQNAAGTDQDAGYPRGDGATVGGVQSPAEFPPGAAGGMGEGLQEGPASTASAQGSTPEASSIAADGSGVAAAQQQQQGKGETTLTPENGNMGTVKTPSTTPSAWEEKSFGVGGAADLRGEEGAGGGAARGPLGGIGTAGSAAGTHDAKERVAPVPGGEGRLWGADPEPEQQQQQQQEQHGNGGIGHEAEGWDWADPWGQGGAWGAPAWGATTVQTPDKDPAGGVPLSQPGANAGATATPGNAGLGSLSASPPSPAAPGAATGAGSGWGSGSGGDADRHLKVDSGAAVEVAPASPPAGSPGSVGATGWLAGGVEGVQKKEEEQEGAGESELARTLAEAREELEAAREAEAELRAALKDQAEAKASALAAAEEKAEAAEAFARQQAEQARENATAAGQWLVSLGLEQGELKDQLAAAQLNCTSLMEELSALKESAAEAQTRANSSEIRANSTEAELEVTKAELEVAKVDVGLLDESLKQYMDGDGHHRPQHHSGRGHPLSWRRVSTAYLRPLLPSKLKEPTPAELEAQKLNISLGRAVENNTALAEAVGSKDDLIKDLNSRIKQFQLHAVRRKKGYRALKLGLAELTDEVQAKESMLTILAVCMIGTNSILESMDSTIRAQQADIASIVELVAARDERVQALTLELESGTSALNHLRESMRRTESALSAVAVSLGAGEECVQKWKDAVAVSISSGEDAATPDQQAGENDGPLAELLQELHAAAAKTFLSPLGLEPTTGAITVAVPRVALEGDGGGTVPARKRGFWGGVFDCLCCRRR
ncbi:unnamed protein product [Scytosiphon promiscuus]